MSRTWKQTLVSIPGIGISLLPKLACPLCWPAYAGLLSSVGLGFLISSRYLLPFTAAFLALALGALAFRARRRHGYGPFTLGLVAAIGVIVTKFEWESNLSLYGAVGLLVIASLWNVWPRSTATNSSLTAPAVKARSTTD
jgi:mercuric ion transport protein